MNRRLTVSLDDVVKATEFYAILPALLAWRRSLADGLTIRI